MRRLTLLILCYFMTMNSLNAMDDNSHAQKLKTALTALDHEFDDCFAWWGKIYDPESGGFYYSLSSKQSDQYGPFIEATSKAMHVLNWSGLLDQCSDEFKQGIITYFQSRQDPETGFFRDPHYLDQYDHKMLSRSLGMSLNSLEYVGAKPLHPQPFELAKENADAKEHFKHLESIEALEAWLDTLPWERRAWSVGGRLLAQKGSFNALPEETQKTYYQFIHSYALKRQLPTGYFGPASDHWTSALSGTYKICSFFETAGMPLPNSEAILKSTMHNLFHEQYTNLIVLYNTSNLLSILDRNGHPFDIETKIKVIDQCTSIFKTMHAPDGGFVTHINKPAPVQNGIRLADPVIESNTNATGLAHKARRILITFATGREAPHPHPRGDDFLKALP